MVGSPVSTVLTFANQRGLHARASAKFVQLAKLCQSAFPKTAKPCTPIDYGIDDAGRLAARRHGQRHRLLSAALAALTALVADKFAKNSLKTI